MLPAYRSPPIICCLFYFHLVILQKISIKKVIGRLTEHSDVIKPLRRGAPRLGLALGPAPARAGPRHIITESANAQNYFNPKVKIYVKIADTVASLLTRQATR